jgi:succinoglycan biosynthesis protein ExoV
VKLFYYPGLNGVTNFGDELNPWLWSRLLPDLEDRGEADWLFVGIGTLINDRLPRASRTIVFGSGIGYGDHVPRPDSSWRVHFVRGPRSAAALGLSSEAALTDPANLVASVWRERPPKRTRCAFMPHWVNANEWIEALCREEGVGYVDPRWPVELVLERIAETGLLLAEAMHGAIVADTLRVPWIPIRSVAGVLEFKWLDWCESVGIAYEPQGTLSLWAPSRRGLLGGARGWTKAAILARQLRRIAASGTSNLSSDATWRRLLEGVERKLADFRAETEPRGYAA